ECLTLGTVWYPARVAGGIATNRSFVKKSNPLKNPNHRVYFKIPTPGKLRRSKPRPNGDPQLVTDHLGQYPKNGEVRGLIVPVITGFATDQCWARTCGATPCVQKNSVSC